MHFIRRPLLALVVALLATGVQPAAPAGPTRFAVIGDFGLAGPNEAAVAALVTSWAPDFIVTTGDNNYYDGAASTIDQNVGQYYHAFIHPYVGAYGPGATVNRFFPALGNHDWETAGARPHLDYFTLPGNERYYDVVWGPVHVFVVDSDFSEPDGTDEDSAQAAWLEQRLAASPARWKVVVTHHPPYSSGPHGPSTWMQWPFEAWGADAVLSGHDHIYERITAGDFPYFVNGLGGGSRYLIGPAEPGSQVRYADDFGAMLVDADDSSLQFRFISRTGAVVDAYTLYTTPSSVAPAAPSGVVATPVSGAEVDVSWVDNASNESEVVVQKSVNGGAFTTAATAPGNITTYPVSGLLPLTTYRFRVVARNAAGASAPSAVATVTTGPSGPPAAPTGLTARGVSPTDIALAWIDASTNERAFLLEQSVNGEAFAAAGTLPRDSTARLVTGLSGQATYAFRLRAVNAYGSSAFSNTVTGRTAVADLVARALTGVPAAARPGETLKLTTRVANDGTISARSMVARFYLIPLSSGPIMLTGKAGIASLAAGAETSVTASATVPTSTALASYGVRVCVDDTKLVAEADETNNCLQPAGAIQLALPDLQIASLDNPPAAIDRGESFKIRDEVKNQSIVSAPASSVRYYLSPAARPGTRGPRLSGTRTVPLLGPGQTLAKTTSLKITTSTATGTYRLLACADDKNAVREADEGNNCRLSASSIRVD